MTTGKQRDEFVLPTYNQQQIGADRKSGDVSLKYDHIGLSLIKS